jgi:hypothetical protein
VRRVFKDYGRFNGKCEEVTSLRDVSGTVFLEPFEEVFYFKDQPEAKKLTVSAAVGKSGGGITDEELVIAKTKLFNFLRVIALNKQGPDDAQAHIRCQTGPILFTGTSPVFFLDPKTLVLRQF